MKDNTFLSGTILVAALIVAGALIYSFGPVRPASLPASLPAPNLAAINLPPFETSLPYSQTLTSGGEVLLGDPNAPAEIVEYGDYQCPFCAKFALETEPRIRENYIASGKAKMVYKDLIVVENFIAGGRESSDAALAANCAADQNKFWEYHDALFIIESADGKENSGNLTKDLFLTIADKFGMDKAVFESCYDSKKYAGEVRADTEEAGKDLSRLATPSSLVNGEVVAGAVPYNDFAKVIDKHLNDK